MVFRMDLAETPMREREEHLDEVTSHDCAVPFRSRAADPQRPMTFVHMHRTFGELTVFRNDYSNYAGARPTGLERTSDRRMITIGVPFGPMRFEQADRQVAAGSGSLVAFWGYAPYRAEVRREIGYVALVAPVDALGLPHLLVRNVTGVDIGSSPVAPVLAVHLLTLLALPELGDAEERALEPPTRELVRALLVTAAGDEFAARHPLERTLELRAAAYLEANFTDPDVSVEALARHLGLSRTAGYALLKRMDVPFTSWVKARRLTRAAELLTAPATALAPIATIGTMAGMPDPATFARAFRSHHGMTPTQWRESRARPTNG
jgi:AraC-like DNA-binding protein